MRYRKLGRTGLLVSELCLGTNTFGGAQDKFWARLGALEQDTATAVVASAVEGGVNFIDTADMYALGESETRLGQAIKDLKLNRHDLVICTKGAAAMGPGPNQRGASRGHVIQACESSLKRLGTDYLDVYMMHQFDPLTPLEETMRALNDLVRSGKVRYLACSNYHAWEVVKANAVADREGLARFEVVENQWSLAVRDVERDVVPMALSEGVGIMAWGALLGGILSGKYQRDGSTSDRRGRANGKIAPQLDAEKVWDTVDVLREIAQAHDVGAGDVALAFLLHNPATTAILFGATSPEQVTSNLRASGLTLSAEELQRLDAVSAPKPDFGLNFVTQRKARTDHLA
jgi:aryl-alcohol dehydrogenase-like predicted oxidoreductase